MGSGVAGVPLPLWVLPPSFCRWWLQIRVLIPDLAVGRGYGQGGYTNLEVLRSRDECGNVASEGTLPMAIRPWHFPRWHCVTPHSHPVPGQGMELPLLPAMPEPWGVPCQPSRRQEIAPGTSHFSRKSENTSNVRTWPNDSEGLCYGNAEPCPPGLVAPGISLGRRQAAALNLCSR